MPDGAKTEAKGRTRAEILRDRLAAELRSNLRKRKQQARGRDIAAEPKDKRDRDG